jgi:tetratricopeptide (TPR) repeat protein
MLVDHGLLRRDDGRWAAAADLRSISIPPTISSLLGARLERLSREERAVIQRASVVGKVFWWGAVAELSPDPERPGVGGHLQSLVRRELVRPDRSSFTGEDAFRFSHILIRDAAYLGTTKELRAELHERFAGWLERRAAGSPEHEELVGYHLEQAHRYRTELGMAEDRDRAVARRAAELLGAAGQRAFARYDIPAAIALLSRAVVLLDNEPLRPTLQVPLGEALGEAGQTDRSTAILDEALNGARALGDDRLVAHAVLGRWFAVTDVSRVEALLEDAAEAIEVFERHGDRRGLGRGWALTGRAHWHGGRAARAEVANEEALRYAREAGDIRQETECLLWLGAILAQGPRPAEEAAARALTVLDEKRGNRTIEAYMSHALAHLLAWQGRFDEARDFARRYTGILTDNGQASSAAESLEAEADVARTAGDIAEAARLLEEGQRRFDEMGVPDHTILPFLANALYLQGRDEEAKVAAIRAREAEHPLWGTAATAVLAKVRARQGRGEEAERLAREALATFEASDFLVFRGRAFMDLAEVLRSLGREGEARPLVERAVENFDRKGAVVLADQARSALHSGPSG